MKTKKLLMIAACVLALFAATFTFGRNVYNDIIRPTETTETTIIAEDDNTDIVYYGGMLDEVVVTAY